MMASFVRTLLARLWHEDEGLLTFEYVALNTLLVLGTVGAMSGVRDTLTSELGGLSDTMRSLDQMRPASLATANSSQAGSAASAAQPSSPAGLIALVGNDSGAAAAEQPAVGTFNATAGTSTTTSSGVQL